MSTDRKKPIGTSEAKPGAEPDVREKAHSGDGSNAHLEADPNISPNISPNVGQIDDAEKPLQNVPATADLLEAVAMRMPFGRFKGERLIDLPEPYVVWFRGQGFPPGVLGQRMALVYEMKLNGLEKLIRPMLDENN